MLARLIVEKETRDLISKVATKERPPKKWVVKRAMEMFIKTIYGKEKI